MSHTLHKVSTRDQLISPQGWHWQDEKPHWKDLLLAEWCSGSDAAQWPVLYEANCGDPAWCTRWTLLGICRSSDLVSSEGIKAPSLPQCKLKWKPSDFIKSQTPKPNWNTGKSTERICSYRCTTVFSPAHFSEAMLSCNSHPLTWRDPKMELCGEKCISDQF